MNTRVLGFVLLTAGLAMLGCSSSDDSGPTIGSQCHQVTDAVCRAAGRCGLSGTLEDCVQQSTAACCKDKCSVAAISAQSDIDKCVQAVNTSSCDNYSEEHVVLPDECHGVIKAPESQTPGLLTPSYATELVSQ